MNNLWQVSLTSLRHVQKYRVMRKRCLRSMTNRQRPDGRTADRKTQCLLTSSVGVGGIKIHAPEPGQSWLRMRRRDLMPAWAERYIALRLSWCLTPIVVTFVQLLGVTLQCHANNELRPNMFSSLWSNTLELTPVVCWWSITDTDSVLCASEDCVILQSIRNSSIAPAWQFRL